MLRLTEVQLHLDHTEAELAGAILARLGVPAADLLGYTIYRRAYDARKKSAIIFIYTLDVELRDEAAVKKRLQGNMHVTATISSATRQRA